MSATVPDPSAPAKLALDVGGYSGDYWILEVGPNYEYAVVGHPSRLYYWILSRTPTLDAGDHAGGRRARPGRALRHVAASLHAAAACGRARLRTRAGRTRASGSEHGVLGRRRLARCPDTEGAAGHGWLAAAAVGSGRSLRPQKVSPGESAPGTSWL